MRPVIVNWNIRSSQSCIGEGLGNPPDTPFPATPASTFKTHLNLMLLRRYRGGGLIECESTLKILKEINDKVFTFKGKA
jgi:hypothetical protein